MHFSGNVKPLFILSLLFLSGTTTKCTTDKEAETENGSIAQTFSSILIVLYV